MAASNSATRPSPRGGRLVAVLIAMRPTLTDGRVRHSACPDRLDRGGRPVVVFARRTRSKRAGGRRDMRGGLSPYDVPQDVGPWTVWRATCHPDSSQLRSPTAGAARAVGRHPWRGTGGT